MSLVNPNNSSEILYGASGDVRNEINTYALASGAGHYVDETEVPGSLIIRALERATRLINGYLEVVYAGQIPFTTVNSVPVMLDDIGSDIATFYALRANVARVKPLSPEKRRDYFDDYVREGGGEFPKGRLPMLRDRELQLPELSGAYTDEVKTVRGQGQASIFDVDAETNWEVDPRTKDDIDQERN